MATPNESEMRTRETDSDSSARFSEDQMIRRAGFRIDSRPPGGPPVWARGGKTYAHHAALRIAGRESKQKSETRGGL